MSFYEQLAEKKDYYYFDEIKERDTPAHFHGAYEFLFILEGEQEVIIDGQSRILKKGEGCFSDRFSVHSYLAKPNAVSLVMLGHKRYFDPSFAAYGNKIPPRFFKFENFPLLRSFLTLFSINKSNSTAWIETLEGITKVLLAEIAEHNPFERRQTDKQSALVNEILKYADAHLNEDLSLRAIAKKFSYSHEHLSRLLHKYLQENWNTFVNRLRVQRANILLKKKTVSVLSVALDCGFESMNTFYRAYKREFGKPPKQK